MSRIGVFILLVSLVAGWFGLGTIANHPATAAIALIGVFLAVLVIAFLSAMGSQRRWIT